MLNRVLWVLGGVFLYVMGANVFSLFIDWILVFWPLGHEFLRPIHSDINTTVSLAFATIICSHVLMVKYR